MGGYLSYSPRPTRSLDKLFQRDPGWSPDRKSISVNFYPVAKAPLTAAIFTILV